MKKENNINIQKIILSTVAIVGIMSVAVVAPNALQVIGKFSKKNKRHRKYYINTSIKNLLNRGKFIRLTEKGEQELAKYELGDLEIKKPKKWDKKWRVVIFDIKETRKGIRTILRNNLNRLGFIKLQNSVWVFPYECQELIIMLKSNLFLGKDVLYMTVENLENDKWLKEEFMLR
jgi:CRISPR-associated endonuclease Cas2